MSIENKKTLAVYDKTAHLYLASSIEHDNLDPVKASRKRKKLESLIKSSFACLPSGSKIFEIGSADGANSKFIESLGFNVTSSDIADDFINATKSKGLHTIKFNVLEDDFPEKYSGVFCWRVLVHFTKEDALTLIQKVYDALEDNGILVFNAINRDTKNTDEEWVDFEGEYHMGVERYYSYFRKEELDSMIDKVGFKIHDFFKQGGDNNDKWLIYVLRK